MKILIFAFYFLISNSLFGQIIFEPTFINQCSNEVVQSPSWTISDSLKTYEFNKRKSITLPKLGNYKLHVAFNELVIDININKNGITRDTFFFKRITHGIQISNPPHSDYFDCDSIADGKITDYYFNGKIRMKGTFEKSQLIDSLFSYTKKGQLTEVFIPNNKDWKRINYFTNGKIKSIFDSRKKYEKKFYPSGQLKKEKTWSKQNESTLNEYFPNGFLKRNQSHKKLEFYNQNKVVVEKMKRKEILIFERLFKKKKHGREKFYAYQWESFDDRGIIKRKMIFDSDHFDTSPFPDSVQQIDDFLFEEIIFYFNGKEFKKVVLELENRKNLSRKLVVYRKEEKKWAREKTTSISKIHSLIENYSN